MIMDTAATITAEAMIIFRGACPVSLKSSALRFTEFIVPGSLTENIERKKYSA